MLPARTGLHRLQPHVFSPIPRAESSVSCLVHRNLSAILKNPKITFSCDAIFRTDPSAPRLWEQPLCYLICICPVKSADLNPNCRRVQHARAKERQPAGCILLPVANAASLTWIRSVHELLWEPDTGIVCPSLRTRGTRTSSKVALRFSQRTIEDLPCREKRKEALGRMVLESQRSF